MAAEPLADRLRVARGRRVAPEAEGDIGALGIRVERPAEIGPALAKAIASKRPAVIDVATDIEALAPTAVA